jgi:hypothetical protein
VVFPIKLSFSKWCVSKVSAALNCNEKNIQLVHSAVGNKKGIIVLKNFDPVCCDITHH